MNITVRELLNKLTAKSATNDGGSRNYLSTEYVLTVDGYDVRSYCDEGHISFYDNDDNPVGDYQLEELIDVHFFVEEIW